VKKLALVAALLSAGCDDPAVTAKVSSVLEHGAVQAELHCLLQFHDGAPSPGCSVNSQQFRLDAHLFQDGSSFVKFVSPDVGITTLAQFNTSGSVPAVEGYTATSSWSASIASGEVSITGACPNDTSHPTLSDTVELSGCTGFNLEAFGIEE
jgi:hypothetical protein